MTSSINQPQWVTDLERLSQQPASSPLADPLHHILQGFKQAIEARDPAYATPLIARQVAVLSKRKQLYYDQNAWGSVAKTISLMRNYWLYGSVGTSAIVGLELAARVDHSLVGDSILIRLRPLLPRVLINLFSSPNPFRVIVEWMVRRPRPVIILPPGPLVQPQGGGAVIVELEPDHVEEIEPYVEYLARKHLYMDNAQKPKEMWTTDAEVGAEELGFPGEI